MTNLSSKLICMRRQLSSRSRDAGAEQHRVLWLFSQGLVLALTACTLPAPVASNSQAVTPADPVLAYVATAPLGQPGDVTAPAYGGTVTVDVQSQYFAASGSTCRTYEVSAPGGGPRDALACKDGSTWQNIAPLISGTSDEASP